MEYSSVAASLVDGIYSVHDTSLDLSGVNCHDLKDFLAALTASEHLKEQARFEAYLMIAKFPQLPDASPVNDQHTEIHDILKWLCQSKKVEHVKELVVRDRHRYPHAWETIHTCVQNMQVKQLDWKALNICLSNHQRSATSDWRLAAGISRTKDALRSKSEERHSLQSVEQLTLYTDGDLNTLHQWYGPDGLKSLENVCLQVTSTHAIQPANIFVKLKTLKIKIVTVRHTVCTEKLCSADFTQDSMNTYQQNRIKTFLEGKVKGVPASIPIPSIHFCAWSDSTDSPLVNGLLE